MTTVILQDMAAGGWLRFGQPLDVSAAYRLDEVRPALQRVPEGLERGLHAAGFLSYEAAPAFDPALSAHPPAADFPLAGEKPGS